MTTPTTQKEPNLVALRLALRPAEAAQAIGISERKLFEILKRGELKSLRVGSCVLVRVAEIERFLLAREAAAAIGAG